MNKYVYSFVVFCIYFITYNAMFKNIYMAVLLSFVSLIVSYTCVYACNRYVDNMKTKSKVLPNVGICV